ncbi:hypothetical protein IL306_005367 [Fusarium sp. DS 682]|nr:hypothetical protein IL306_005367 [Fusarium sp. DS 682]
MAEQKVTAKDIKRDIDGDLERANSDDSSSASSKGTLPDDILNHYALCASGKGIPSVTSFHLSPDLFKRCAGELRSRFYSYDYYPEAGLITIKMESPIHAFVSGEVAACIGEKIKQTARLLNATVNFRAWTATGLIKFIDGDMLKPDGGARYLTCTMPGIVLEVANSQKLCDAIHRANKYITKSNGRIKAVIVIDLTYQERGSCTVSVLRARPNPGYPSAYYPDEGAVDAIYQVDQLEFKTPQGQMVNPNSFIELNIQDVCSTYPSGTFRVYCHELSAIVDEGRIQEALGY